MQKRRELVSIEAAASNAGVAPSTLYRHLAAGRLTRYKAAVGRVRLFVDSREVRALLEPRAIARRRSRRRAPR